LIAVTPSITFSRSALDVFGLNVDRMITGNAIAQFTVVFRIFVEVKVRLITLWSNGGCGACQFGQAPRRHAAGR
jgi:hypothetical protein